MSGARSFRNPVTSSLLLLPLLASGGCGSTAPYPNRPITLICPWAVGGGTDRVSRQMAAHLETELGVPLNVVNATGGKGVTGHSRGLRAQPDGYTLTTITLELNMLHWSTPAEFTWRDFQPLMSINEDSAALFVRRDAPWNTLGELADEVRRRPGELRASGTATGGAWHLALAGWLLSMDRPLNDIVWVSSTGAGPSLQELTKGGFDLVCCSLPEARLLMAAEEVRCLGVMAEKRAADFPDVPTFREQGFDWTLTGWRGLAVPKGTSPEIVARLESAIEKVVSGQTEIGGMTFPDFMKREGFDNTWREREEFERFLAENDAKFGKLLTSDAFAGVSKSRFGPMLFPYILLGLLGLLGLVMAGKALCVERSEPVTGPSADAGAFAAVVLAVVAYIYLAPIAGFVLTVGVALALLIWRLGGRLRVGVLVGALFAPAVYTFFTHLLRVPLPRGWLGW